MFEKKILDVRRPEQKAQQKAAFMQSVAMTMTGSVAILAAVVTVLSYSLAGNQLTAPEVFTVVSIFGAFQFSLGILPQTVRVIAEAAVALRRLKNLLLFENPPMRLPYATINTGNAIEIDNATFGWDSVSWDNKETDQQPARRRKKKPKKEKKEKNAEENHVLENNCVRKGEGSSEEKTKLNNQGNSDDYVIVLKNINLTVPDGGLVGICGTVGCGKSSLISAISGGVS
jgi:ATP-binding cassette subfamily C (CFTR/MRP) protein 5